jgi:hypothetical protein
MPVFPIFVRHRRPGLHLAPRLDREGVEKRSSSTGDMKKRKNEQ